MKKDETYLGGVTIFLILLIFIIIVSSMIRFKVLERENNILKIDNIIVDCKDYISPNKNDLNLTLKLDNKSEHIDLRLICKKLKGLV